jgi:hypothetical protein
MTSPALQVEGSVLQHTLEMLESVSDGLLRLADKQQADTLVLGVAGAR